MFVAFEISFLSKDDYLLEGTRRFGSKVWEGSGPRKTTTVVEKLELEQAQVRAHKPGSILGSLYKSLRLHKALAQAWRGSLIKFAKVNNFI